MGNTIVKPNRFVDFYVLWSTETNRPIGYGTYDLVNTDPGTFREDRMKRADLYGSSCRMCTTCWSGEDIIVHNVTKKLRSVKHADFSSFVKEFIDAAGDDWNKFTPPKAARAVLKKYGTIYDPEDY